MEAFKDEVIEIINGYEMLADHEANLAKFICEKHNLNIDLLRAEYIHNETKRINGANVIDISGYLE